MLESSQDYIKLGIFYIKKIILKQIRESSVKIRKDLLDKLIEFLMVKGDKNILVRLTFI